MLDTLYKVAVIVIAVALLWIGWELRGLRSEDGIRGTVETRVRGTVDISK